MIDNKTVLALIPARAGSKGLPGKNTRVLHNKPLVAWPIEAALASEYIDMVVCSTDSEAIADIARKHGAQVPFLRPAALATDTALSSDVIYHALSYLKNMGHHFDYLVLLEPTSPLTETHDINKALNLLIQANADAIVGACKIEKHHPQFCARQNKQGLMTPYAGGDFAKPTRRQDLDPLYFFEGSLYISRVEKYMQTATFYHDSTLPYIVPEWKALEIDTLLDFFMIETVMKNKDLLQALDHTST